MLGFRVDSWNIRGDSDGGSKTIKYSRMGLFLLELIDYVRLELQNCTKSKVWREGKSALYLRWE